MNCKPGDFAKVVISDVPGALGLVVEVLGDPPPEWHCFSGAKIWDCRALGGSPALEGYLMPGGLCVMADYCLRPIRGDESPEDVRHEAEFYA